MLNASYFHSQAEKCLRLAGLSTDKRIAAALIHMAEEFTMMAEKLSTDKLRRRG